MKKKSNFQEKITFIWDLVDLLSGDFKRNEYQEDALEVAIETGFPRIGTIDRPLSHICRIQDRFAG